MQKRASEQEKQYPTVFEPLPTKAEAELYFDTHAVTLPCTEQIPKLHYHNRFELGICEGGDGLFLSEGRFYALAPGDVIFLAPGKRHYSRSLSPDAPCYCRFVYLSADALLRALNAMPQADRQAILDVGNDIPTVLHPTQAPLVAEWIERLVALCREQQSHLSLHASLYLACLLLDAKRSLPRSESAKTPQPLAPSHDVSAAVTAAEHLSLYYHLSESSAELAKACHISESQLRRQFLHAYGTSPIAYRNRLRCKIARELLLNRQLTVADVSQRIGYKSTSDFCRAFRKVYGASPSEYRKRHASTVR